MHANEFLVGKKNKTTRWKKRRERRDGAMEGERERKRRSDMGVLTHPDPSLHKQHCGYLYFGVGRSAPFM